MLRFLAIITSIILEYIYKSFKVKFAIQLYQKLLNRLNIIYLIKEIVKPKYEDFAFFMLDSSRTSIISKIIIFVNNIDKMQYIAVYFHIIFLFKLKKK